MTVQQIQNYAHLLFNAIRETLETMAFAEVIPCSLKIDDVEQEFDTSDFSLIGDEDHHDAVQEDVSLPQLHSGYTAGSATATTDDWGTPSAPDSQTSADDWGTPSAPGAQAPADDWGTPSAPDAQAPAPANEASDSWGVPEPEANETVSAPASSDGGDWGTVGGSYNLDPWGDTAATEGRVEGLDLTNKGVDFNELVDNQEDWCWSCMKVNSPDIHAIWFIVSWGLAVELAKNMYAGEAEHLSADSPLIRDLIAELTNVLGGRLMILLEKMGGSFTLTVPEIGTGMPTLPEGMSLHTVLCKVVIDDEYPVITTLCFNK